MCEQSDSHERDALINIFNKTFKLSILVAKRGLEPP